MTRTELLVDLITHALDQDSRLLNSATALRGLSVIVKFNVRTGQPRSVLLLPEVGQDLQAGQEPPARESKG